ncbi:CsbD family protein [Propionicicella superfundia]|uniref:CsbD family protein n=1 Tax=Propionicicella superfundia TaxID=348582 RepID=UPI000425BBE3|nr:CsbD family protein [Propionicicella superfundia]
MGKLENTADDAKGRVKEAAGALSGDERLKAEGKLDQAAAAVKDAADHVTEKVEDAIDAVKDKLSDR